MKPKNRKRAHKDPPTLPELDQTKKSVLNSLTSLQSRRSYQHAMDEFIDWYCSEPRLALNRTVVLRYRLQLEAKRERRFYAEQSEALSKFISYLGTGISIIFSIGAVIGAAITMYASVASRTGEIGTLRALGFSRGSILAAFLGEALLLGLLGGVVGLLGASTMQAVSISTTNFQTFAEIAFSFTLTPGIVAISLAFSLAMGFVGGFLPAARAAQMKIVDALRAA